MDSVPHCQKMLNSRRKKALFLIMCCGIGMQVVYELFYKIHCYDLTDGAYQPPQHLVRKWASPLQLNHTTFKAAHQIHDKFPARNPQAITRRIEKFFALMQPLDSFLSKTKSVTNISTKRTGWKAWHDYDDLKSGIYNQLDVNYLRNTSFISTTEMKLNVTILKDIILSEYYDSTATNCTAFNERSNVPVLDIQTCSDDPSKTSNPKPLQLKSQKLKDVLFYPSTNDATIPLTYIQTFQDAFVDGETGDITTETIDTAGDQVLTEIVIRRCTSHNHNTPTKRRMKHAQVYNQVFSISQFYGYGYFHHMSEQLPRLVPFLKFLHSNPQVFVHVARIEGFVTDSLELLGIAGHRIISGDIQASILYSPLGGLCGRLPLIQGQMLSLLLRQQIKTKPTRKSVVLIQRSYKRYFSCHNNIRDMLQKLVPGHGLELEVFGDYPPPGFQQTAEMFNRAVMVVGPHGAGLANMVFCEPGTIIIEGVCSEVNHCYQHSAFVLGHRHVAINYPNKTCNELQAADIEPVVKYFLQSLDTR